MPEEFGTDSEPAEGRGIVCAGSAEQVFRLPLELVEIRVVG